MKYRVAFTRRAQADLHGIFDYLADRFGLTNAQRYVEQIEKTCLRICLRTRPGGRPGLQSRHKGRRVSAGFSL